MPRWHISDASYVYMRKKWPQTPGFHSPQRLFRANELRFKLPMTIALPISGELVHTATNCPEDAHSWQNEPGPGAGETAGIEVARRSILDMEPVAQHLLPRAS